MRFFGFFIFCVSAVFKKFSIAYVDRGFDVPINCKNIGKEFGRGFWAYWREDYIYPVKVCATLKGGKVKLCDPIIESKFQLYLGGPDVYLSAPINLDNFKDSDTHCHVFNASQFAVKLKDVLIPEILGIELKPNAFLYGTPEPNKIATVQESIEGQPYYFDKPGNKSVTEDDTLHAVVCNFPNCTVTIEGLYTTKTTEYFRKKKGYYPQYIGVAGPVTDDTFSVTSVECEAECPTKFIANYTAIAPPMPPVVLPMPPAVLPMPPVVLPMPPAVLPTPPEAPETPPKAPDTETDATQLAAGAAQTTTKSSSSTIYHLNIEIMFIATVLVFEP